MAHLQLATYTKPAAKTKTAAHALSRKGWHCCMVNPRVATRSLDDWETRLEFGSPQRCTAARGKLWS